MAAWRSSAKMLLSHMELHNVPVATTDHIGVTQNGGSKTQNGGSMTQIDRGMTHDRPAWHSMTQNGGSMTHDRPQRCDTNTHTRFFGTDGEAQTEKRARWFNTALRNQVPHRRGLPT